MGTYPSGHVPIFFALIPEMPWGYTAPVTARFVIVALLFFSWPATAQQLGVNIYGLSYHFDRERAQRRGLDNEVNPGVGLRYRVLHSERLQWIFEAGAYHDSGRNTAVVAGAGALWRLSAGWRLGGGLAALQSDTYNRGEAFIAPFPLAAYEFRRATLNFTYIPRASRVNDIPVLAAWLTWWL